MIGLKLSEKKCLPCEGGITPLSSEEVKPFLEQVPGWEYVQEKSPYIRRIFKFKDFKGSWHFFDSIASIAEDEGHHPDILVQWNRVTLTLTTHALNGLSENDFILASKIDQLPLE